jgi:hypothetical protein
MQRKLLCRSALTAATLLALSGIILPSIHAQSTPATPEATFQSAQRHIYAAIGELQTYLQESPGGKEASTANLQLSNLRALSLTAAKPAFVKLYNLDVSWRIVGVDAKPDDTAITFEIKNNSDSGSGYFYAFDQDPLVLIDNKGQYYPAGDVQDLPPGVTSAIDQFSKHCWVLHGGQSITLAVHFPPLQPGAVGGQVLYSKSFETTPEPAKFSLLNKNQTGGG